MRYLLDTHTLLWFLKAPTTLPSKARSIIIDPTNELVVNVVSFWEMAIKNSIRKLDLEKPLSVLFSETRREQIRIHPDEEPFILIVNTLPFHHNDPFDRMMIAQCLHENIPILSVDAAFDAYGVNRIWN